MRALIPPMFRPVTLDDPLYGCQADPRTFVLVLAVKALERLEQLGSVVHVETDAVVGHAVGEDLLATLGEKADLGMRLVGENFQALRKRFSSTT